MNCPNCNKSLPADARFCPQCGQEMPPIPQIDIDINTRDVKNGSSVIGLLIEQINNLVINLLYPSADRDRRNKALLRDQVKLEWIEKLLKDSEDRHARFVPDAGLFKLHKRRQPEAVDHYSAAADEVLESSPDYLPQDKKIGEIFYEMARALLILGPPGSGKTVTLLELAPDLVSRAEKEVNEPIPMPFARV